MPAAAARASRTRSRAIMAGLPPSRMSVPRPAMLVEMVTDLRRPACEMISPSRCAESALALSTSCLMPSSRSLEAKTSDDSTLVVPTSTGRPSRCRLSSSSRAASDLPLTVLYTASG